MKILIGCEFSGRVRDALTAKGFDATSCDLLPSDTPGKHYQGDIMDILYDGWDALIAFPPCTHLAVSGARWFKDKVEEQKMAITFTNALWNAPIKHIGIENPIGVLSTKSQLGKPTQIIQPWQFGHGVTKATCLWLKNLPTLQPTNIVEGREGEVWKMPPSPQRAKLRSLTYQGVADAMAEQWSNYLTTAHST